MEQIKITFSNNNILVLKEGDCITPIVKCIHDNEVFASMSPSILLEIHIYNGLIPSLISALYTCDFFYVNSDQNTAYGTKTIVSIEMC